MYVYIYIYMYIREETRRVINSRRRHALIVHERWNAKGGLRRLAEK